MLTHNQSESLSSFSVQCLSYNTITGSDSRTITSRSRWCVMAAVGWTLTGEIAQRGVVIPAFSDIFPRHQIQTEDLLHESYVIFVLHFSEDQWRDHAWGKSQIRITALKRNVGLSWAFVFSTDAHPSPWTSIWTAETWWDECADLLSINYKHR